MSSNGAVGVLQRPRWSMISDSLSNIRLFRSQQHYLSPCQSFQSSWHLVHLTHRGDEYEMPLCFVSPHSPLLLLWLDLEVKCAVSWSAGLGVRKYLGTMQRWLLLQDSLYLLTRLTHGASWLYSDCREMFTKRLLYFYINLSTLIYQIQNCSDAYFFHWRQNRILS